MSPTLQILAVFVSGVLLGITGHQVYRAWWADRMVRRIMAAIDQAETKRSATIPASTIHAAIAASRLTPNHKGRPLS